ncbi:MAG: DUF4344 domain-containing metallopeptidase [Spirochaetaceae bacterium]|jgi:hypothetical protein|nr:DUF4344 domain-containing metallopeptidase [Spirochaetaceae bacterium]
MGILFDKRYVGAGGFFSYKPAVVCLCLALCLAVPSLTAQVFGTGVLGGRRNVRVVETQWFDIIYPPESAATADILRDNADGLYKKAAALFGAGPEFRIPVVISLARDELNAYFSPMPRNHIVVYDTPPDYSLTVSEDTLLSVFYHELIHAVTLTIRGPVMQGISGAFGDPWSIQYLNMPQSIFEGSAVLAESLEGEGRLNSDFALHILRQAKIEGKFPSWEDATGFRDSYPGGNLPYIFGGAFYYWLTKTYGMDAFIKFWQENAALHLGFSPTAFRSTYGMGIREAWQAFMDQLPVPDVPMNPLEMLGSRPDVFPTRWIESNGLFSAVTAGSTGAAWFDQAGDTVYFLPAGDGPNLERREKLFSMRGIRHISFSPDGSYLTLSRNTEVGRSPHNEVIVYDTDRSRFFRVNEKHLRDGTVVTLADGLKYVCAVKTDSQYASLVYYSLNADALEKAEPVYRYEFRLNAIPFSPVDMGLGLTGFLLHEGNRWMIAVFDAMSGNIILFDTPDPRMELRHLNARDSGDAISLYFSWTRRGLLPRFGSLEITKDFLGASNSPSPFGTAALTDTSRPVRGTWRLMDADVSGGVYSPAPIYHADYPHLFVYGAKFFETNGIFSLNTAQLTFTSTPAQYRRLVYLPGKPRKPISLPNAAKYHPLGYWGRGFLVPIPVIASPEDPLAIQDVMAGLSYLMADPGESAIFLTSVGISLVSNERYVSAQLLNDFGVLSLDTAATATLSDSRFKKSFLQNTISSTYALDANFFTTVANRAYWEVQHVDLPDRTFNNIFEDTVQVSFSNLRRAGKEYYETFGVTVTPFFQYRYFPGKDQYQNIGLSSSLTLPRMLPFQNPLGMTVNLPFSLGFSLFPRYDYFGGVNFSAVLFSTEIQKGLPGVNLFFRRVSLLARYSRFYEYENPTFAIQKLGSIFNDVQRMPYTDLFMLSLVPELGLNTGVFTYAGIEVSFNLILRQKNDAPYASNPFSFSVSGRIKL